jgi:hypothetical protein
MWSRTVAALLVPLAAGACVQATAPYIAPNRNYAPVPEDSVHVYLATDTVPATCERYALINAEGDADLTNESQMLQAAKRRAGKIGANAIQVLATRDPSTGTRIASVVFGTNANRKGQLLAFRCSEPQTQAGLFGRVRDFLGLGD